MLSAANIPAFYDQPSLKAFDFTPVSISQPTRSTINLPKNGANVSNPTIQAAKAAFGVTGATGSLPSITSNPVSTAGESKSQAGDISSTFRSGDIAFGSTPIGSAGNINLLLLVAGIGIIVLFLNKKKS